MNQTFLTSLLITGALALHAAAPAGNSQPRAAAKAAHNWTADFIWSDKKGEDNPPVTYFRKRFELAQPPKVATITATGCRFKLYVNGAFVGEGVPRSVRGFANSVVFDVAQFLHQGTNAIAVEAQYRNPTVNSGVPPWFSAVLEADGQRITTDSSWKVFLSPAWLKLEGASSSADFIEVYHSALDPEGWKEPGFKDTRWASAVVTPAASVRYTSVTPSLLPNFQRQKILPAAVTALGEVVQILGNSRVNVGLQLTTETLRPLKFGKVTHPENLLKSGAFTVIEPQVYVNDLLAYDTWWEKHQEMPVTRDVSFIVDFGAIRNGYIALDVEGNRDATIDVAWGQTLIEGRVLPITYSRGKFDTAGTPEFQFAQRWYLRGGRQQLQSMNYKSFRYLQVTVRDLTQPLKIHELAAIHSFVPMKQRGQFACSDAFLTEVFAANLRTLQAASYDSFMDNTIREKNLWGGAITESGVSATLAGYGDHPMIRNNLDFFARSQAGSGEFPQLAGSGPASEGFIYLQLNTAEWMAEYGGWCDDPAYFRAEFLPALERFHSYWRARENQDGLITLKTNPKDSRAMETTWVDWASENWKSDFKPGPQSLLLPMNLTYAHFLETLAGVYDSDGAPNKAAACRNEARKIGDFIFARCWDDTRGLYIDGLTQGKPVRTFSEHANFLALACGLGREGRTKRILAALPEMRPGAERIVRCSSAFLFWPFEGLFNAGADEKALDLMRERYHRFTLGDGRLDCFWEEDTFLLGGSSWNARYRSLAQNHAGSPAYQLLGHVLGVRPVKLGFTHFEIRPQLGDLEWAEGTVPSPKGDIPVRVEKKDGKLKLAVTVPAATSATVIWPDGKTQRLESGSHQLSEDSK